MYCGIDQSLTSSGLVVLEEEGNRPVYMTRVATGKLRGAERLAFIRDEFKFVATKYDLAVVAMEGYSYDSTGRVFELGEVGGILKLFFHDRGVPLLIVPPASLKQFTTDSGSANKKKMAVAVLKKWQQVIEQDDVCDAYALAQVARGYVKQDSKVRVELEVLKSLVPNAEPKLELTSRSRTRISL